MDFFRTGNPAAGLFNKGMGFAVIAMAGGGRQNSPITEKGGADRMKIYHISGQAHRAIPLKQGKHPVTSGFRRVLTEKMSGSSMDVHSLNNAHKTSASHSAQTENLSRFVKIGTISSKTPTVSNLLVSHSELKQDCWEIIHAQANRGKDFTRIQTGTTIYLNPETKEVVWGEQVNETVAISNRTLAKQTAAAYRSELTAMPFSSSDSEDVSVDAGTDTQTGTLNENFLDAVKGMIGRRYSDINCYELVVNGLEKLGVKYAGNGGLGHTLITMAVDKGLPENAYLTGEGLIQASGSKVYSKAINTVKNPERQAQQLMQEILPHLEKGSILSFSTESKGHTGVISSRNGKWTFINSGVMDHSVGNRITRKGVGEETLNKEIENWCELAADRRESLVITLGRLSGTKLAAYTGSKKMIVS